jgi:hypothetical protein
MEGMDDLEGLGDSHGGLEGGLEGGRGSGDVDLDDLMAEVDGLQDELEDV